MQKCRFDKESNFLRAFGLYLVHCKNKDSYTPNEQFLNKLAETFVNPEDAAKAVEAHLASGIKNSRAGSSIPVTNVDLVGNYTRSEDNKNVESYYIGSAGFTRMVSKFRKDILECSMLEIYEDGGFNFINGNDLVSTADNTVNANVLQERILKYKERLINDLCSVLGINAVSLTINTDDNSFTNFVNAVLGRFETLLKDRDDKQTLEANGYYDSYVILKNFDRLIERYTSYIGIDQSYKNNKWEGVKKYNLSPRVQHYSGFSKDEGADVLKQFSDLAETILKVIPEVDANGNNINNSIVGSSGFTGSMTTLKTALLYSDALGSESKNFRDSYSKGIGSLLQGRYNINRLISDFIFNNTTKNVGTTSAFGQFRQVYIHNKLRGISKFLFSERTPNYIKGMFAQMFMKTEATGYRAYTFDYESDQFIGKDLRSVMVMSQKRAIESVLTGGLSLIKNGSRSSIRNITDKWEFVITPNENRTAEDLHITNNETGQELVISYGFNKNNTLDLLSNDLIESNSEDIVRDFMHDVYCYLIPDTYETCIIDNSGYRWENDFAPFIILAAKEINAKLGLEDGISINLSSNGREINLSQWNAKLLAIARRLGVIYGDSIHSTVRNLSGNNLPLFQLTSLEYNWKMLLDDAKSKDDGTNSLFGTLLWDNENLLGAPQRRSEIQLNGKIKSSSKLNKDELLKISIVDDFITPFLMSEDDPNECVYFQNDTFSDKSTQFLITAYLNKHLQGSLIEEVYGKEPVTLKNIIQDSIENGSAKIWELIRLNYRNSFSTIANNILSDYAFVFPEWNISHDFYEPDKNVEARLYYEELVKLDKKLQNSKLSVSNLRDEFIKNKRDFVEEIHCYVPKNESLGKVRINETLLSLLGDSVSPELWYNRISSYRSRFTEALNPVKLNGFTNGVNKQIDFIIGHLQLGKKDPRATIESTHDKFYNKVTREYSFISNGVLNPIAETYFAIDCLLTNSFNQLTTGNFFVHPNKNKDTSNYLTFSEANRFVNKIKRNVIYGSTIHPFAQGVLNESNVDIGVTPTIDIAIIEHFNAYFYTPNGVDSKMDAQDGCGWCTMLQSILENNSLLDAKVGDNKKTILHDVDDTYGRSTLLKWAVYALSNSVRRNAFESNARAENLVYKMYSHKKFDFSEDIGQDYQQYRKENGSIYIYNPKTCVYKELTNISKTLDKYGKIAYIANYADGTSGKARYIRTLWDIDQLFGGAFTYTKNEDGSFTGTEASQYLLADIACKYNLKDKQIAYAVSDSGCKVGATNINPEASWYNNYDPLQSYTVSTKYAGVMMDADHELDMADVREMSQMMSSLCEDGHYTEWTNAVYEEIGNIAFNNAKIQKYIKAIDGNDLKTLRTLVGKSLIESFQTGSKDTIGLAQAFIKRAETELENSKLKGVDSDFIIPYSDPTIFGAFVADVISRFNKDSIIRRWDGFAGILNPSHDIIMYYRNPDGQVKLFKEFNEECMNTLRPIVGNLPDEFSNWVEAAKNIVHFEGQLNPYLVKINSSDIDFEDTIYIETLDLFGNPVFTEKVYIDSQTKRDRYRNYEDYTGKIIYRSTASPRNLLGTRLEFNINSVDEYGVINNIGKFSIYDTDYERVANYILNGIDDSDPYKDKKLALITKVLGDPSKYTKEEAIAFCTSKTQQLLKALDTKGEIEYQECFGELNKGKSFYAESYEVRPGEIIIGRYQLEKLGITDQDHLWEINGPEWFLNKLRGQYQISVLNVEEKTEKNTYDRVLYHNNIPFLVKVGNVTHGEDGLKERPCVETNIVGDDLRFETEVILTNESDDENHLDNFKFSTIEDDSGNKYYLVTVNSKEDMVELTNSPFFDRFYRSNHAKDSKSRNSGFKEDKRLQGVAEDRWEAYKKVLEFVGARIPTQSMQSYMPNNVIAVTDSKLNVVYASKASLAITGGDFDGDKYFLLTCSISPNGTIQSGSALQKLLGYKTCIELLRPNKVKYQEGENGYVLNLSNLNEFKYDPELWDDSTKEQFVNIVNDVIKNSNGNIITFFDDYTQSDSQEDMFDAEQIKESFLELLNRHTLTKSYIANSIDVLKNRGFSSIRKITLAAQNQLKANITVDSCTEELKVAAANTTSGKAEKYISPFIPSSRYEMQQQGILGKEVVGIGAVSLKSYFMLENRYNNAVLNLRDALISKNMSLAEKIMQTLFIYNPIIDAQVSLANANFDPILDYESEILSNFDDSDVLNKSQCESIINKIKEWKLRQSAVNAPEYLSAIVSLAADNMKDLALPKLNATPDLVDLYTTAAMICTPFSTMSKIMTSQVFGFLNKYAVENIFDESTYFAKIDNAIKTFNDPSTNKNTADVLNVFRRNAKISDDFIFSAEWYNDRKLLNDILEAFVRPKTGIIETTPEHQDNSQEAQENRNEIEQDAIEQGFSLAAPKFKSDMYNLYRYTQFLLERLDFDNGSSARQMTQLEQLIEYANEVQLLGQLGSINQGLKTDLSDFYNFGNNIKTFMKNKKTSRYFEYYLDGAPFNFRKFLKDPVYREKAIAICDGRKSVRVDLHGKSTILTPPFKCFNVLRTLAASPNFFSMTKLYPYAEDCLKIASDFRNVKELCDKLLTEERSLNRINDNEMKEIVRYIQDMDIIDYLYKSNFVLDLDAVIKEINSGIEIYQNYGSLDRTSLHELSLNTPMNIASFKHIMEAHIIPELKRRYPKNSFISELLWQNNPKIKMHVFALPIPMMNIDKDASLVVRYTNYLRDFNEVSINSFAGVNIGSLFFLYNLIVNKNQFGNQSFTRIFEDLVNTKFLPNEITEYYNYINYRDNNVTSYQFNDLSEIKYRLEKYVNKATKVKSTININGEVPEDLAFDLPRTLRFYSANTDSDNDQTLFKWTPSGLIRADEVIEALANSLNEKQITTRIISDEDVVNENLPKEKAFIKNGVVYINSSYFTNAGAAASVGIHEMAHLLIATIKQLPVDNEVRRTFYQLVKFAKNDKDFENIAKLYPDRVGSDLAEEIICNKLEKLLLNQFNTDSSIEIGISNNKLITKALSNLFKQDITDYSTTWSLDTLVQNFAKDLFEFENQISKDYIIASQKLAELKTRLLKSDKDNYRLDQICK